MDDPKLNCNILYLWIYDMVMHNELAHKRRSRNTLGPIILRGTFSSSFHRSVTLELRNECFFTIHGFPLRLIILILLKRPHLSPCRDGFEDHHAVDMFPRGGRLKSPRRDILHSLCRQYIMPQGEIPRLLFIMWK